MKYRLIHKTVYEYTSTAEACHNLVRLTPREMPVQACLAMALEIDPPPNEVFEYDDYFGNHVHSFATNGPHERLSITARSTLIRESPPAGDPAESPAWEEVVERLHTDRSSEVIDAVQYVFDSRYVRGHRRLRDYAQRSFAPGRPILEAALELTERIHAEFAYDAKATRIDTPIHEVLERRRGVCQDFAHLQIGCLRALGLACRYVSGYLRTVTNLDEQRLQGADASHAWVAVWCPDAGWVDLDPTNGCRVADGHIALGWGRDFQDVSPVKGVVLGGGTSTLTVAVDVVPVVDEKQAASPAS